MKILHVITRLNVGGPTKHLGYLSHGLTLKGVESCIVSGLLARGEDDMTGFVTSLNCNVISLKGMRREISLFSDIVAVVRLLIIIFKFKPDIVDSHMAKAGLLARFAVCLYNLIPGRKVRSIHTFHGHVFDGYFSGWKVSLFVCLEQFLAKYISSVLIVLSDQQLGEISNKYRIAPRLKCKIIPLGIQSDFVEAALMRRADRRRIGSEYVFGFVGRLTQIKQPELFINAALEYNLRYGEQGVSFVLFGAGDQEFSASVRSMAATASNIKFMGNVSDAGEIYGQMDCLVLTSKNEGTPVVILEAFASKTPVLSTSVGGVVDLLGHSESRGVFLSFDPVEISQTFRRQICSTDVKRLEEAEIFFKDHHSVEALISSTFDLYEDVVGGGICKN